MRAINKVLQGEVVGSLFGKLKIMNLYIENNIAMCQCLCSCGSKKNVKFSLLKNNNTKSCGCIKSENASKIRKDLTGNTYFLIRTLSIAEKLNKNDRVCYNIYCDPTLEYNGINGCGKYTTMRADHIKKSFSCGCYVRAHREPSNIKHGDARTAKRTELYKLWTSINVRCNNVGSNRYRSYLNNNIKVCDSWKSGATNAYVNFKKYVLDNLPIKNDGDSLDRIDVFKDYEPGNIRWADKTIQANNKRKSINIAHDGGQYSLTEIAKKLNCNDESLRSAYTRTKKKGIDIKIVEDIQNLPPSNGYKKNIRIKSQKSKFKEVIRLVHKRFGFRENDDVTAEQLLLKLQQQNNLCKNCLCKMQPPTVDHISPLSIGGYNTIDNIQLLCRSCNSSKNINQNPKPEEKRYSSLRNKLSRFSAGLKT